MDVEKGRIEWLFITFELKKADEIASLKGVPKILHASALHLPALIVMEYAKLARRIPDTVEISHHLAQLLRSMVKSPNILAERAGIGSNDDPRGILLEKINRYARLRLKEAPTINDLADALGYSVSYMRTVFRMHLGIGLGKYIRESRLSKTASLLPATDKNISEIAAESGFKSLFAFLRAFKKAWGMAPKTYSKLLR